MKYRVKRRNLSPAKRNPFRPRQTIKRGKWVSFGEFETWEEALSRATGLRRGMTEVAIFYGNKNCIQDSYGRLPTANPFSLEEKD